MHILKLGPVSVVVDPTLLLSTGFQILEVFAGIYYSTLTIIK